MMLITGPNMAGKSTIMRQVALAAIMNQMGGFVAATTATLPIFDSIFTRVGASDDISKGMSTFMVEMSEAAHILRSATGNSLVILDEVGRGTSSEDGLAIASAILETLATIQRPWGMFATHYHELVKFSSPLSQIAIMQTEVIDGEEIVFTHRLIPGASGNSYGLDVAKQAGVPKTIIDRATALLSRAKATGSKNQVANCEWGACSG
jgi:DNA mismatch repair protein MutS